MWFRFYSQDGSTKQELLSAFNTHYITAVDDGDVICVCVCVWRLRSIIPPVVHSLHAHHAELHK
jgi:hypothetical protein